MAGKHGMPTANLDVSSDDKLPELGVYSALVFVEGVKYMGVTNVGYRPSVGGDDITIETYILNLDEDIYDKEISVELYHYLRPTQNFNSLYEVKEQIDKDCIRAVAFLNDLFSPGSFEEKQ